MSRYAIFLLFLSSLISGGCTPYTQRARITQSVDVTRQIRLGEMNPDYNYYLYWNGGFAPTAILGLDKRYSIQSNFWKAANPTEQEWKKWSQEYTSTRGHFDDYYGVNMFYKGYKVLAPGSAEVGLYYSGLEQITFKFHDNDVVEVYPPHPSSQQFVRHGFYER